MYTRSQYLNKQCTMREYYTQLVTDRTIKAVIRKIGVERLLNSKVKHFADIPLAAWHNIPYTFDHATMDKIGAAATLATHVLTMKETASQIVEQYRKKESVK